jgi:predicted transcriptional regulator
MSRPRRVLPIRPQMSLAEIAEELGTTKSAVNMCLVRALKKLRSQGLVFKMQELADDLDRNRKGCAQYD